MKLSTNQIQEFANYLSREEKSDATKEKYLRDVQASPGGSLPVRRYEHLFRSCAVRVAA